VTAGLFDRSRRQGIVQGPCLLEVARIKALSEQEEREPVAACPDRAKSRHAHSGTQFPGFCLLLTRNLKRARECDFAGYALDLGPE
jgi:hypothetical protein